VVFAIAQTGEGFTVNAAVGAVFTVRVLVKLQLLLRKQEGVVEGKRLQTLL
jgi:hypothetical protein